MFCVPCKDLPGGMLNSLDLPCIQTSFSWSRLNSTTESDHGKQEDFFAVAELMCYLDEVYHQTIPCSKQQLPPMHTKETAHSSGTKDFFLNLGPLWLESYWFTVILEPFSCYWLTIIWILPSAEATPTKKSELPIIYSVYTKHLSRYKYIYISICTLYINMLYIYIYFFPNLENPERGVIYEPFFCLDITWQNYMS